MTSTTVVVASAPAATRTSPEVEFFTAGTSPWESEFIARARAATVAHD